MNNQFNMLVLTDHTNHISANALYSLAKSMTLHPNCACLDVATRGKKLNQSFFYSNEKDFKQVLTVTPVDDQFDFHPDGKAFENKQLKSIKDYQVIWLRLPPPLSPQFLNFLKEQFPNQLIINDPMGIWETGTKSFLCNFQDLCPPMKLCQSIQDIEEFKSRFPIVLKPLREYGGRGIVRIEGDKVWEGKQQSTFTDFVHRLEKKPIEYLGVKFLKNVGQGDKRIIVVKGEIMGASLRLPAKGSWLCNISMGGSHHFAEVTTEEQHIIEEIDPTLSKMGIVMYGIDTLVDDNGKRVLSEINTTSIGGLPDIAQLTGKPLVAEAVDLIWKYITEKHKHVI